MTADKSVTGLFIKAIHKLFGAGNFKKISSRGSKNRLQMACTDIKKIL
jgi:hypothetical protein